MSTSIYQNANLIGAYVARKVLRLQSAFLGSGSGSADARASLARLRRLDKPSGGAWASAGDELFSGLPDIGASRKDEERMLKTIKASLKLYAVHQQSKQKPMALGPKDADDGSNAHRSFGWSCRQIEPDIDSAAGVVRRLVSVEAARDFAGIENCLRGLIQLMRANDVPVDYYQLARDLYLMQFDGCRDDVFMRWSRDYYRIFMAHDGSASDAAAPEEGEN